MKTIILQTFFTTVLAASLSSTSVDQTQVPQDSIPQLSISEVRTNDGSAPRPICVPPDPCNSGLVVLASNFSFPR
ncbi:MAG TPA: hypothetical protein VKZ53_11995 [Candidatus Angelobacter sp.]|nr:hypothetical protein [Candidatus Angelobacter sp.]